MAYKDETVRAGIKRATRDRLKEMAKQRGVPFYQLVDELVGVTPPPAPPPPQSEAEELVPVTDAPEEGASLDLEEA